MAVEWFLVLSDENIIDQEASRTYTILDNGKFSVNI